MTKKREKDKYVKLVTTLISMMALVWMGAMNASCSSDDNLTKIEATQPEINNGNQNAVFTVTVSLDERSGTRALNPKTGVKTFAEGDQIALIYKDNTTGQLAKLLSNPLTESDIIRDGKSAIFKYSSTPTPVADSKVRYIYPASMAEATMPTDVDADDDGTVKYSALYAQDGTAASLANVDLAIYDGAASGTVLPSSVTLENQLAIIELYVRNDDGAVINSDLNYVDIDNSPNDYFISPAPYPSTVKFPDGPIYLAMRPVTNTIFSFRAKFDGVEYPRSASGQTLEKNKIYTANMTLLDMTPGPDQLLRCTPLTFEAKTAGAKVTFTVASGVTGPVFYSTNDGITWSSYTSGTAVTLTNAGNRVMFKGDNATYSSGTNTSHISCSEDCYAYGNMMSLITSTGFSTNTTLDNSKQNTFWEFFKDNTHLLSHDTKTLLLPAVATGSDRLPTGCYDSMFKGCTSLNRAPELPSKRISTYCYTSMFDGCTSLTTAPMSLPATTAPAGCYENMFCGCSNLTYIPATLSATTLGDDCYRRMFMYCVSLTASPVLENATFDGTFKNCYKEMFFGCTLLSTVTCLNRNLTSSNYTDYTVDWLSGVAATGTFYRYYSSATWWDSVERGPNSVPAGWTITNN